MSMPVGLRTSFLGIDSEYMTPRDEYVGDPCGAGPETQQIARLLREALQHFFFPVSRERESVVVRFTRLAQEWKDDTAFVSSIHTMAMHPAYQQIVGMGERAVPLMLAELSRQPDHWFWALAAITGIDPVPRKNRGDLAKMTDAWLAWGRTQGYIN